MLLALLLQERSQLEQYLVRANDPIVIATALGVAFFLGAAHALTPGHGKAVVAAYLVGAQGRIVDAVYLGVVITLTHTASVFALGLITLYASTQVSIDRIFPWLSLVSGALVFAVGMWLLWKRSRGEDHGHSHDGLGFHHHGPGQDHGPPLDHARVLGHSDLHSHDHAAEGRGSLLSLGISGGLVPCPEALVVLMLSISLRRILLGLGLLGAFSLGLAAVLIAIGITMVLAGPAVKKITGEAPWLRSLPVVSAAVVTVVGLVMVVQAARTI